jgi:hypothetical protein
MTRAPKIRHDAPLRRRALLAGLVTALLAGSACSAGGATEAAEHNAPTFRKATDEMLRFTEPVSSISDLLAPAKEGEPWRVVGSVLEPANNKSVAAVWTADDGRTWEREEIDPADSDLSESMAAVAHDGDSLVAVGRVAGDDESDAAIWRTKGDEWELSTPEVMSGKHDQWAFDVAVGAGGAIVAGGENAWGEVRPRLWFSADGTTWTSVDGGPGGAVDETGEESIQDITAYKDGFVAVGWRDVNGEQSGAAWFSPDGTTWEEVEAPTLGGDGDGRQSVQSVTAFQDKLVAGGFKVDASGQGKPVVWMSADGKAWGQPSGVLPIHDNNRNAANDMSVQAISVVGNVLLAGGGDDWRPHLWKSANAGATWELLPDPTKGDTFDDGVAVEDIAGVGEVTVAIGSDPIVMEMQGPRWLDRTGDAFPAGGDRPAATSVVMADDDTLVATGYSYRARTLDQRRRYVGRVWYRDGGDLVEIKPEEPEEGQPPPPQTDPNQSLFVGKMNDVVAYKGGYVAVGFEDFSWAAQRTASDTKPDGVLWTSENGRSWERQAAGYPDLTELAQLLAYSIDNPDANQTAAAVAETVTAQPMLTNQPAGGTGTRALEAVAPLGDGFIAVGSQYRDLDGKPPGNYDTDPIVAVSADGKAIVNEDSGLAGPTATQRFRDVCVVDGKALAIGVSGTDNDYDVAVRLRDTAGKWQAGESVDESFTGAGSQQAIACAASKEGFILVGSDNRRGNVDARVWVSEDGLEWRQLSASSLGGSGEQEARAVAAVPDGGWLLGGVDTMGGDSDAALWRVDENGDITRRDRDEPSLGGAGTQTVAGIYVTDSRVVVVGEDQAGVGIWESKDLDR